MNGSTRRQAATIVHFFDWFNPRVPQSNIADSPDWARFGLADDDRGSVLFYQAQFAQIRKLGIEAIAWELCRDHDGSYILPSGATIQALRDTGLRICPFIDLELSVKVLRPDTETMTATLTTDASIFPDQPTVDLVAGFVEAFCALIPPELRARDARNRGVVFVFGYGFTRDVCSVASYDAFAINLVNRARAVMDDPVFYWTFTNSVFLEHLLLRHRDHFCAFHFVLDQPLAQFGSDAVTWNFGFDNGEAAKRDGTPRVVRNDLRYIEEMGWLAAATDPAVVFIYSWDEPFEGSMLLPSKNWGDTKARLAHHLIERVRAGRTPLLPSTLVIINPVTDRPDDWHTHVLRDLLWYALRRLAPQSEVRTAAEANAMDLGRFRFVVDLTVRKSDALSTKLRQLPAGIDLLFTHPLAGAEPCCLTDDFAEHGIPYESLNREGRIIRGNHGFHIKDDVKLFTPGAKCTVLSRVSIPGTDGAEPSSTPLVSRVGNRVWLNAFTNDDQVIALGFEALYGRSLQDTVLYGEGYESQRLTVSADRSSSQVSQFHRRSINERWKLPEELDLVRLPADVDSALLRAVYGLDRDC